MARKPQTSSWETLLSEYPRVVELYRRFTQPGHEHLDDWDETGQASGTVRLTEDWFLDLPPAAPEMLAVAARDLRRFLKDAFGVKLAGKRQGQYPLRVIIDPVEGSVQGKSPREHVLDLTEKGITITGASEWGAACGLYHLQRLLRLQAAPVLSPGCLRAYPRLSPALAYPAFKAALYDDLQYPEVYDGNYLIRLARAGYSGFHFPINLRMFYSSHILPELNHPQAEAHRRTLAQIVERARQYALEVYLTPYLSPLPEDHPLFLHRPELRGSSMIKAPTVYLPCSSQEPVVEFYAEQISALFREAPGLAGVFLITGCEGFLHCYTAPYRRGPGMTNCPQCSQRNPEAVVAHLLNSVARAVKAVDPQALVVDWSYGAHAWTETRKKHGLISRLSPDCAFMANLDTGDLGEREGVPFMHFDYNLTEVGPSKQYLAQTEAARRRGLPVLAKLESGTPVEFMSIPGVPALTRWARKFAAARTHADGAMFNWDFSGYLETLPGELAGWMSWEPCPDPEVLLRQMAAREFGAENQGQVLAAWKQFDRALDFVPFSGPVIGHFRGPFYIGFAQPLLLDPLEACSLPVGFRLRGGRNMVVTDLRWTQPFGAEVMLRTLGKMERHWRRGHELLQGTQAPAGSCQARRLEEHQALCEGLLCVIRTAINTVRFLLRREELFRAPSNLQTIRRHLQALRRLAREELTNAEDGLACMKRNPLIGYDYIYRGGFNTEKVESKIALTRQLIDEELPFSMFVWSHVMHSREEWLWDDGRKFFGWDPAPELDNGE